MVDGTAWVDDGTWFWIQDSASGKWSRAHHLRKCGPLPWEPGGVEPEVMPFLRRRRDGAYG